VNSTFKTVVLWVVLIGVVTVLWQLIKNVGSATKDTEISFTAFQDQVNQHNVKKVTIVGNEAHGEYVHDSSKTFHLVVPAGNPDLLKDLRANNVEVSFKDNQGQQR
jgi:ATP-dependent Zn protease